MVNDAATFGVNPAGGHPERALALSYAAPAVRPAIAALFALDRTLARLALGTRDPMVAQLRLAWWGEALRGTADGAGTQPILRTLAAHRVDMTALAAMVDGWERLLSEPDLTAFAADRAALFVVAAAVAGAPDECAVAGQGWALADLSAKSGDPALARRAARDAAPLLATAAAQRWSAAGRFLGGLVHVARADLAGRHPPGSARRVARLAWHRVSGR